MTRLGSFVSARKPPSRPFRERPTADPWQEKRCDEMGGA